MAFDCFWSMVHRKSSLFKANLYNSILKFASTLFIHLPRSPQHYYFNAADFYVPSKAFLKILFDSIFFVGFIRVNCIYKFCPTQFFLSLS